MIERVEVTFEDVKATQAFKNADTTLQEIYSMEPYVKDIGRWLTVGKYKGKEVMLSLYHMTDFKKSILTELYDAKLKAN